MSFHYTSATDLAAGIAAGDYSAREVATAFLDRIAETDGELNAFLLVDTPGAFPGVPSEERHIAEAIAVNIREMFNFRVPIVAVVIGEGGSGGALGIGVADRVLILENAYNSVI